MSQPPDPERYLELFDKLDLDNIEDRRIGVHLLRNYFSTVLTDVAEEKLGSMTSINQDYLDEQWRQVRAKFESIPGQIPEEIEILPFPLIQARNPVTHNDRYDPRQEISDLQEIRDQAPEWRREVEEMAEAYFHAWENKSPKESLINLAEQNLQQVLSSEPRFDKFANEYSIAHEAAKEGKEKLQTNVDPDRERIEKELVEVVEIAQSLVRTIENLEQDEIGYEDYLANDVRDRMLGR
ncbi:hypothetical protein [Natrarchaeobaculum sulfurireducens]|uniref:Uncharacterized protein n=1 Tax=Natrarchaeobaculum sulfurireducens TaxID=2044521 RepID=A0A346P9I9_9EURY|nr:hypothetical protein [Natrarchaeobaculum sulfurireducens]AXR76184.1 hypothetical protein AArc1_4067 [Natrarchaeobaculum sulfurireducens]